MSYNILAIPALHDNYIWMIVHPTSQQAIVVDPGEADAVLQVLEEQQLKLAAIFITHHHWDHTNGIDAILAKHKAPVYGPATETISHCDHPLKANDRIELPSMDLEFNVIETPGHTSGHITYCREPWIFTGDTLFTGGCGRLFEGTPDQLYHSLCTLAELDPETRVYCGHEYTEENLRFAEQVEPDNLNIQQRLSDTEQQRSVGVPTVPATIGLEQQTNPFLRCHLPNVQAAAEAYCGQPLADKVAVFAALRRWKDEA